MLTPISLLAFGMVRSELIVTGIAWIGCMFILTIVLRTFTGRSHRRQQSIATGSPVSHPRSVLWPMLLGFSLLGAGVFILSLMTLNPGQLVQKHAVVSSMPDTAPVALVVTSTEEADLVPTKAASKQTDNDSTQLPLWTKDKETTLTTGEVPHVLFVETSGLYSTQEEAMAEAMKNALSNFRSRLAGTYSKLAIQPVPESVFRESSVQEFYVEKRMHNFGIYEEPMYRVYLQYMDSAEAREPVIEAWKRTFSSNQATQFGIGFGALAALLGVLSAGLRAVSAAKGSRGRVTMTALAFAGLGLVGLIFVA